MTSHAPNNTALKDIKQRLKQKENLTTSLSHWEILIVQVN